MITIKNDMFDDISKLEEMTKDEYENLKDINFYLFQVITYIELFKNYRNELIINIDVIMYYFGIKNTKKNRTLISKSLHFLHDNDFIYISNLKDGNLPIGFIEIEIQYDERYYRNHSDEIVFRLIDVINSKNEKFIIGLLYYYIVSRLDYYSKENIVSKRILYYSKMSSALGIKSKTTLKKYIDFLEDNKFIKSGIKGNGVNNKEKEYWIHGNKI